MTESDGIIFSINQDLFNQVICEEHRINHPGRLFTYQYSIKDADAKIDFDVKESPLIEFKDPKIVGQHELIVKLTLPKTIVTLTSRYRQNSPKAVFSCKLDCKIRFDEKYKFERPYQLHFDLIKGEVGEINFESSEPAFLKMLEANVENNQFLLFLINDFFFPYLSENFEDYVKPIDLSMIGAFLNRELQEVKIGIDKNNNLFIAVALDPKNFSNAGLSGASGKMIVTSNVSYINSIIPQVIKGLDYFKFGNFLFDMEFKPGEAGIIGINGSKVTIDTCLDIKSFRFLCFDCSLNQETHPVLTVSPSCDSGVISIKISALHNISIVSTSKYGFIRFIVNYFIKYIAKLCIWIYFLPCNVFVPLNLADVPLPPVKTTLDQIRKLVGRINTLETAGNNEHLSVSIGFHIKKFVKNKLSSGESLPKGGMLDDGRHILVYKNNGDLVLYDSFISEESIIWRSFTGGYYTDELIMEKNGMLVLYCANIPVWRLQYGCPGCDLLLHDTMGLVIQSPAGEIMWSPIRRNKNTITVDEPLLSGQYLETLSNNKHYFVFMPDGEIRIRNKSSLNIELFHYDIKIAAGGKVCVDDQGLCIYNRQGQQAIRLGEEIKNFSGILNFSNTSIIALQQVTQGTPNTVMAWTYGKIRSELRLGEIISKGEILYHRHNYLFYKENGDIAMYRGAISPQNMVWHSFTQNIPSEKLILQPDHNLVLYDKYNSAKWASNTKGISDIYKFAYGSIGWELQSTISPVWRFARNNQIKLCKAEPMVTGHYIKSCFGNGLEHYLLFSWNGYIEVRDANKKLADFIDPNMRERVMGGAMCINEKGQLEVRGHGNTALYCVPHDPPGIPYTKLKFIRPGVIALVPDVEDPMKDDEFWRFTYTF